MQNIGNTYQTIKNNVASNGNVNSTVSKQNASDFSDLFCSLTGVINSKSLTATSSVKNYMNVKSSVRTIKNVKSTSSNKTLDKSSNMKTDTIASNKNSVKQNNHAVKKESAKDEDVRANLDDEENLSNKNLSSNDEIIISDLLGTENTELVLDNTDLLGNTDNYTVDFSNSNQLMNASDVNALNQKIELVDKIVQRSSNLISSNANNADSLQSSSFDTENLKNSLLNLSNEDLSYIENLDDSKLNEFVKTAIDATLKSDVNASKNTLNASPSGESNLDSWFNELLGDAEVESVKVTTNDSENTDFGAEDFDLIEQSLKLSQSLDEKLSKADVKSKIVAIMDSKEEASENTLAKSLELLRGTTQGNTNTSSRVTLDSTGLLNNSQDQKISSNGFQSLEQAIKSAFESSSSVMSSDLSQKGNSDTNQNHSFQSMLQQSAATNKENTQNQISKQFDLLSMSSNLKQNAQALTEKVMQMASKNLKTMDLTLNPHGLGKMKISLDVGSADDVTKISISASSPATKALVEQGMEALRQTLRNNDINAKTEVTEYEDNHSNQNSNQEFAGNEQQSQHGQQEQNHDELSYGAFFATNDEDDNQSENLTENQTENIMNSQNGDSVSYFA
ncbi:MAG: flagellar hook-length control protein FliK [Succinivibrio sp.]|nr:flagellar hook-length control protein FliK [Succinatimonas sp.]MDY6261419.1 flagellar hook-length control protein FliK [Succinivibrio sp.]